MDFSYFVRRLDIGSYIQPEKEAVIFKDETITYRELQQRVYKLSNALKTLGLQKGDRVAVLLRNRSEWFDIFFALAGLGAVLVPVNFLLKKKEVEFIVNDSEASIMLIEEALLELADLERKSTPGLREIICVGCKAPVAGVRSYRALMEVARPEPVAPAADLDDLFLFQYTSGTTGFPKGAMHTHGTLLWNSLQQVADFHVGPNERYLCMPGLCWVAGFHDFTLAALWMGGTVVVCPSGGLDMGDLLELMEKESIKRVLLVPTILKQVVDYPELDRFNLDALEFVLTGAEPVPVSVIEKFNQVLPDIPLVQAYGLSECPTIALYLPEKDALRKIGSAGKPSTNCELLVVDENMQRVGPGVKGEIIIRSPATMKGYWNKAEATEKTLTEGWLRTGDLAEYDDEGYIYIVGRKKEMFISGGLNIYPAEIENVILKDSRVAEAAVIAMVDEKWGEVGCAVVVPKEGQTMTNDDVRQRCMAELANYKVPKVYVIRDEPLPRTASGKIKKHEVVHLQDIGRSVRSSWCA